ncbi:hypothetical protein HAX54_014138, partial [Datura stramonium]|nr:hypothetical protein [Datura stramonium]
LAYTRRVDVQLGQLKVQCGMRCQLRLLSGASQNKVKIRGQIINFSPIALNRLLGTPNVDSQPLVNIVKKPPIETLDILFVSLTQLQETGKNVTHVTWKRVCLVYALTTGMPINMGEEEVDYRPVYDPRGIDVTKTKELEGVNGPVLSVNEHNARIDNMLSHLIGPGFEEPIDDDVATNMRSRE